MFFRISDISNTISDINNTVLYRYSENLILDI